MKGKSYQVIGLLLIAAFLSSCFCSTFLYAGTTALTREEVRRAAQKTIDYYHNTYKKYDFAGILDWPALGLFGFGEDVSGSKWTVDGKNGAYWREEEVKKGIMLTTIKNTDFQRSIIGVCSAGKNPRDFGGKNLVKTVKETMMPSGHFADSVADRNTGLPVGEDLINAHVFGIIALHCAGEPIPNRDKCLEWLEKQQRKDGGFTWDVKYFEDPADYDLVESDVDMTAAALMGLAILGEDETNPAVSKGLAFLKKRQLDSGGFFSWGAENPESCSWVIQALTLLGIDPMGPEWTKPSGDNPVSAMLRFQLPNGSFTHVLKEEDNFPIYDSGISTYEGLCGLADAYNKKAAYDMLHEKYRPQAERLLFSDYQLGQFGFKETMELVYDYVLAGYPDGTIKPDKPVTRGEFAKYLVYGLGLNKEMSQYRGSDIFADLASDHWADGCIGVCSHCGYVGGISKDSYAPEQNITGEQLMAMLVRAAGLQKEVRDLQEPGAAWSDGSVKAADRYGFLYPGFNEKGAATRVQCAWSLVRLRKYLDIH